MKNSCKMMLLGIIFFVIGNCCNVVEVNQEFARQILVAFAAEQTFFLHTICCVMLTNHIYFIVEKCKKF